MPKQDERLKNILDLINALFGDTSVDKRTTLEWMEEIECAASDNVSALKEDIRRKEG
jgi:hypothetical protein